MDAVASMVDICDFWGRGRRSEDDEVLLERMTEEAGRLFRRGWVAVSAEVSDCSMRTSERM